MTTQTIDTTELETITPRQLRQILFYLKEQDTTVQTLRDMLFNIEEQDKPYAIDHSLFYKLITDSEYLN